MPRFLTWFTGRGHFFAFVGVGFLVAGLLMRQRDLLRVGVLLCATPVLSHLLLRATPKSLRVRRAINPERVTAGAPATVTLTLHNTGRFASRLALVSEVLPYRLGPRPKFVLDTLAGGQAGRVNYRVTSDLRGVYPLGPLRYRLSDPLGMSEVERTCAGQESILVRPKLVALTTTQSSPGAASGGDIGQRTVSPAGEFDVAAREYRHGDDLRRVHWPSTARRGELMMRSEEQSQERLATVVLDIRADAHQGEGARSSLEWAVVAAASICEHLAAAGFSVRLLTDGADPGWFAGDDSLARDLVQDRLAILETGSQSCLHDAVEVLSREPVSEFVVALLGQSGAADVRALAAARQGVAFLYQSSRPDAQSADTKTTGAFADVSATPSSAEGTLTLGGWTCVRYSPGSDLVQTWAEARRRFTAAGREFAR